MQKSLAASLILCISFVFFGCSSGVTVTDSNGTKTTIDGDKKNVTVTDSNGDKTSVSSEDGSIKMDGPSGKASIGGNTSVTEAELGVPFYPGSTEKPGTGFKFEGKGEKSYMSVRVTSDTPDKVADFYKGKVKGSTSGGGADMMIVTGLLDSGAKFSVSATKKEDGKTEISIGVSTKTQG